MHQLQQTNEGKKNNTTKRTTEKTKKITLLVLSVMGEVRFFFRYKIDMCMHFGLLNLTILWQISAVFSPVLFDPHNISVLSFWLHILNRILCVSVNVNLYALEWLARALLHSID